MKILIVRVSSLGDVVHNMPMLADLHRYCPDAQIDWVVEEAYVPLVRLNRGVGRVLPFALRRWRRSLLVAGTRAELGRFRHALREVAYDLVFDTQGLVKTALVMRMARLAPGGRRIGLANATLGSGYEAVSRIFHDRSIAVPVRAHAVARARAVAAGAFGQAANLTASGVATAATTADFCLAAPPVSAAASAWLPTLPYAVFFHGTARAAKQWAPAHWIAVGRMLAARGMPVLLPWGSAAEELAAHALAAEIPGALVLPRLPMMDAVLLAQRAALVVGLDSGLTHIAAAYCRPTIELYCDSPRWKTEGNWSSQIINLGDTGHPPAVADVLAAIDRLLGPVEP
ncbi:MAG: lipopolysaccharide heptosyltransferase I [Herminiimonas sp.]|nr:lipopolysaccharide heptosyltransferase I [Herminiimonas sp.]